MKLKLYWETSTGCKWLEKEVEVEYDKINLVCDSFYAETHKSAEKLLEGWRRNDEKVDMYPTGEVDGKFSNALDDYLDFLYCY